MTRVREENRAREDGLICAVLRREQAEAAEFVARFRIASEFTNLLPRAPLGIDEIERRLILDPQLHEPRGTALSSCHYRSTIQDDPANFEVLAAPPAKLAKVAKVWPAADRRPGEFHR